MELTSFAFFCFFAALLVLYYAAPQRGRWGVLLAASLAYYLLAGNGWRVLFPIAAAAATWALARALPEGGVAEGGGEMRRRCLLWSELLLLLGTLIFFKYTGFVGGGIAAPLGLSFYTFTLLGYFLDVYQGIAEPVSLPGTLLYGMYFPTMVTGPIVKLRETGQQYFSPERFRYESLAFGCQRMLWGVFKKLVIAERLGVLVAAVYGADASYGGAYIWFATVCFAFQLYADFGGCMDIVLGLSEALGLWLPENFRSPFLAETVADYWRRWHITLGDFMKEHVFYPLLRTGFFMEQGERLRRRFGKKLGKRLNTWAAMLLLWTAIGLWHGGALKYVIGSGWLHFLYIVMEEATEPYFTKLWKRYAVDPRVWWLRTLRVLRTFFLVCVGFVFFRADSTAHALRLLGRAATVWNPGVLVDGSLFALGLEWTECGVLVVALAVMVAVDVRSLRSQERMEASGEASEPWRAGHGLRIAIAAKPLPVRWGLWIALLFATLLLGRYGPGTSAAEFIYQGF